MTHSDASQKRFEFGVLLLFVSFASALLLRQLFVSDYQGRAFFDHTFFIFLEVGVLPWAFSTLRLRRSHDRRSAAIAFGVASAIIWPSFLYMAAFTGILIGE